MLPGSNFQVIKNCVNCPLKDRLFCDLSHELLAKLQKIKLTSVYPKGALLCLEGHEPRGVFVLCTGRAKLSTASADGKSIILRVAERGDVLGLTAVLSGTSYEATAETLEPTQANFIPRGDFLRFVQANSDVGIRVAQQLTDHCKCAYDEIRSLGLSRSVSERIARLLLQWSTHPLRPCRKRANEIPIRVTLTQEEIAQFTGTSRETVSRVLGDFKAKGWLRVNGATWTVLDKPALDHLVTS